MLDTFSKSDSFVYNNYNNHEKSGFNISKNDTLADKNEPNDDLILKVLTDCINQQSEREINEHINELTTQDALHDYFKMFAIADSTTNQYPEIFSPDNNIISCDGRISLAYENLHNIPQKIAENFSNDIKCLDLSFNKFKDLSFLSFFKGLNTLILDKNCEPDETSFPYLSNLQILWLNNCNITNIPKWIFRIKIQCPNIKQLSLIGNPGAKTLLTGANSNEENEYRFYVTEILKTLTHLDGIPVTSSSTIQSLSNQSLSGKTSSIYNCGTPPLITFASSTITGNCNEISLQSLLHNQTTTIQSKTIKSKQQQLYNSSNTSILLKNNSINSTIIPSHTTVGCGSKLSSSTSVKSYYFHNSQQQYHQQQEQHYNQQRKKINYNEKDNHNMNNNNNNSINNNSSQNKKRRILSSSFKDMFRFNIQRRKSCQSSTTS